MEFQSLNKAYNTTFCPNKLSIGLVSPIEHYPTSPVPTLEHHLEHIRLADELVSLLSG